MPFRQRGFTIIEFMIVIAIVVIVAVVAVPGILETGKTDRQQKAIQTLLRYADAQTMFRDRGVKKVGNPPRNVFARPFAELYQRGETKVELMNEAFAQAVSAAHGLEGYYFVDDPAAPADSDVAFGLFAIPCEYGKSGQFIYYINERRDVREKDPGENVPDPARYFTGANNSRDPSATGWELAN